MLKRFLRAILSVVMLVSMASAALPAATAGAELEMVTGQTFFLSYDNEIVTAPGDVVNGEIHFSGTGVYTFGSYPIVATGDVDYIAGSWMGQLTLNHEFSGAVTFTIAHADNSAGTVPHGSQTLDIMSPTTMLNFSIPAESFTIPANNGGQILFIISGMDVMGNLYISAGGTNSVFSAPNGSDIFPSGDPQGDDSGGGIPGEPTWPLSPTVDDADDDAQGVPEITGVDYVVDDTNVYIRFVAGADFTFIDQSIAVALDIDNNAATGSSDGFFGPAGTDYKLMCGFNGGVYSGTMFQKYSEPPTDISGAFFTDSTDPSNRYFFFTIPLAVLGPDADEFLNGVYLDAKIGGPGDVEPVMIDQITGVTSGVGEGGDTPSEPTWPGTPFIDDDDTDASGIFEITKVNYLSDPSYMYVRVSADGTITFSDLISRTYFDIDQSTSTGCNDGMIAPLGSDYYVDITWDPEGTPSADVKKWDSTGGNWVMDFAFDIVFMKLTNSFWYAVSAASFGDDFTEFGNGLFIEQQIIDMAGEGSTSDIAASDTTPPPVDTFTLTMAVSPPAGGTVTPAAGQHTYDADTEVTITATPATGYDFVNWTGDVASSTSPQTTVTVDGDKAVTANFQEAQLPSGDAWTVMVYMAADNNLEEAMLQDLNEMEVAGSSDKVNIIALFDGYGTGDTVAYHIGQDLDGMNTTIISDVWTPYTDWTWNGTDEANMGNPGTILEFVHKTIGEYPAEHYALIFSNHGNGWRSEETEQASLFKGVCWDETNSDDYLTIAELSGALGMITTGDSAAIPDGFGIIGFDACLMQMTEIAYELKDYGWFMVGSEESEWGAGWPYDTIFSEFVPANDSEIVICRDFADTIVTNYGDYYTTTANDVNHTLSAVELKISLSGGMGAVGTALDTFAQAVIDSGDIEAVNAARVAVEYFADLNYIDLLDFVGKVRDNSDNATVDAAAGALKQVLAGGETFPPYPVITSTVSGTGHPEAYGLSIYLPYSPAEYTNFAAGYSTLALSQDTAWNELIEWSLSGGVTEPEWQELVTDAIGDAVAGIDIYGVDVFKNVNAPKAEVIDGGIAFRVRGDFSFTDPTRPQSVTFLDTDRNPATGETGESGYGLDIGTEYGLEVCYDSTQGRIVGTIWKWDTDTTDWVNTGEFPVFEGVTDDEQYYYWVMVDFAAIEETDGFMDIVQHTQNDDAAIDKAPDTGHISIAPRDTAGAIEAGLDWLVSQQNPDGSWGGAEVDHRLGETALAVYKLEQYAHDLAVSPLSDDYLYKQAVIDGLDYILKFGTIVDISNPQPNQAPDYVDNAPVNQGISFDDDPELHHSYETYYTSIVAMAIAASGHMDTVHNDAESPLNGMTYQQILANTVDFLAWGQSDYDWARGGWNYARMDDNYYNIRSDESNTGWVTLALAHAEELGIMTPGWVRSELERWVTYIQEPSTGDGTGGGAYYTGIDDGMGVNALRTGNLLQQFAFLGDTATTPRVQLSLDYLARVWDDWETAGPEEMLEGWYNGGYMPSFYHATYTIMKGLDAFGIEVLTDTIDWYADMNTALLAEQNPNGSWPLSSFDQGDGVLSTVWALLTLERDIPETRQGPDLVIQGAFVTPLDEEAGTYEIFYTAANKGNVAVAENVAVTVTINGVLQQIGEADTIPGPLQPGDSYSWGQIGPFTRDAQLDYDTIVITIDPANAVQELNEDNNPYRLDYPVKPDLVVIDKWEEWVNVADPSEGYKVHFMVKNEGNGTVYSGVGLPTEVKVAVALDSEYQAGMVILPGELGPGDYFEGVFPDTFSLPQDGSVEVTVTVDYTDVVEEWDETNNSMTNTLGVEPEDTTAPTVTAHLPDVAIAPVDTDIVITFSEAMNQTATQAAFSINPAVAGTFEWPNPNQLRFVPTANLTYETAYTVTVGASAADLAGNPLDGNQQDGSYNFTFTTEAEPDPPAAPAVQMVIPGYFAQTVPIDTGIEVTFTEPMNKASVESAFSLHPHGGSPISGAFSWEGDAVMTFTPDADLEHATIYICIITVSAQSFAGLALEQEFTLTFETAAESQPQEAVISGVTYNARGEILPEVMISIGETSVTSGQDGSYEITVTETGSYSVDAGKDGYQSLAVDLEVTEVPGTYTVDFIGDNGLIPNAPNLSFVLACINKWKVDPGDETGLGSDKVTAVIHSWKYPVIPVD